MGGPSAECRRALGDDCSRRWCKLRLLRGRRDPHVSHPGEMAMDVRNPVDGLRRRHDRLRPRLHQLRSRARSRDRVCLLPAPEAGSNAWVVHAPAASAATRFRCSIAWRRTVRGMSLCGQGRAALRGRRHWEASQERRWPGAQLPHIAGDYESCVGTLRLVAAVLATPKAKPSLAHCRKLGEDRR